MKSELLQKYNVPAPRYTSYPTVPYWQNDRPDPREWLRRLMGAFEKDQGVSLYIHLPFCERLCTYCGCNKRITKNHGVEDPYIQAVLQEWQLYLDQFPQRPILRELHLGGGTPTFFSPDNLAYLIDQILQQVELPEAYEFGFEAHPGQTERAHLEVLAGRGFRRLSIGIQDFDPHILGVINRQQSFAQVADVTRWARELGYHSINYDLIFGLPFQTPDHIRRNMDRLEQLQPERLAFYSYAHVPWIKPSQRAYSETDLPTGAEKRYLYELGRDRLAEIGYREIGMDHFALAHDSLSQAMDAGTLHRNFMGYTPLYTSISLGLGASAISDSWDAYVQNEKNIETYRQAVSRGVLPIFRGHLLDYEDRVLRGHILNIMCRHETRWSTLCRHTPALEEGLERLPPLFDDGLIEWIDQGLRVTEKGRPFIRNICMALDARYWRQKPEGQLFSQAV